MFPQLVSFFQNQPVKRAYLFGSAARGEQTPESDIDILVELDYEQGDYFRFLAEIKQIQPDQLVANRVQVTESSVMNCCFAGRSCPPDLARLW